MEVPTRLDRKDAPSKADEFIPQLRSLDERVRRAAVEGLAGISMPRLKVVAALAAAAKHDVDDGIRSFANEALPLIGVDPEDAKRNVPDR
jgi:HEAT repeat protein